MGADVITTVYAKMRGYRTQTFRDLPVRHLRPMATADGVRRGRKRQGAYQYIVYYPVTWALLRALVVAARFRPYGLSGFWYLQGYLGAALSRSARVDRVARVRARRAARTLPRRRSTLAEAAARRSRAMSRATSPSRRCDASNATATRTTGWDRTPTRGSIARASPDRCSVRQWAAAYSSRS